MAVGFYHLELTPDTIPAGTSKVKLTFTGSVAAKFENPVHFKLILNTPDAIYPSLSRNHVTEWNDSLPIGIDGSYTKSLDFENLSGGGSCHVTLKGIDAGRGTCDDNTDIDY